MNSLIERLLYAMSVILVRENSTKITDIEINRNFRNQLVIAGYRKQHNYFLYYKR